jgi:hypothetical protein
VGIFYCVTYWDQFICRQLNILCEVSLCFFFSSLYMCGLCYSKWDVWFSVLVVGNDA